MMFKGTVILKLADEGSKSEGLRAFLEAEDGTVYQLYRPQVYPIGDDFFTPFGQKRVEVTGEVENGSFLAVETMQEVISEDSVNEI